MGMFEFFNEHWFLAFIAIHFAFRICYQILRLPVLLIHGWPPLCPTHVCDANGDWHKIEEKKDE